MSSSSSSEERNFGDCSHSESLSSMEKRSSKALEAMLREHDKVSIITESSLPKIRDTYHVPDDFDLHVPKVGHVPSTLSRIGMKKMVAAWAPCLETSRLAIEPTAKKPVSVEVGPTMKRLEKLSDSLAPAPKPKPTLGKGINRKEKGHHHFAMGLIDWVHDTGRVIDNLSRLNEELQADVQKLNDESSPVAVAKVEKDFAVELSMAPEKAQVTIAQYKESPSFKSGLEKMGWVSYEFRYKIALMRF
ncbi:hypothetical protein B296_00028866 [Ensete ventricosum]|uniref:Uncharacterized protein n=1 Tax=Ensete ventricosum TaxID=4639 RepID=A0A427A1S8_ENSVE|nr:hypothetical protein B296_00028866 [Ensete ventricosum]